MWLLGCFRVVVRAFWVVSRVFCKVARAFWEVLRVFFVDTLYTKRRFFVDFRKRQQRPCTPLMISGTPVERVSSFKYLGLNISEDLTWTAHIQTQVKKARERLYHLRQLRKSRVSPAILKTFYSGAIESVLTLCISGWYGNISNQDCKALQSCVLSWVHLRLCSPSLQDIYFKRCKSRAAKIIKDSNHPCHFTAIWQALPEHDGKNWET